MNTDTGDYNTEDYKTGYRNTGDYNTGGRNTGDCNTGDFNTGYRNIGDRNTGYRNTGGRNTGDYNAGGCNTGDRNTGDFNITHKETGFFNSIQSDTIRVFNKPCNVEIWNNAIKPYFIYFYFNLTEWIIESNMTDEEKENNPTYKTTKGYLKSYTYKEAWANAWANATDKDKELLYALPNFDTEVFKEISGIDVNVIKKKKVTLELTDEQLEKIKEIIK